MTRLPRLVACLVVYAAVTYVLLAGVVLHAAHLADQHTPRYGRNDR